MNIAFDVGGIAGFRGGGIEECVVNQFSLMSKMYTDVEFYPFDLFGETGFSMQIKGPNVHYSSFYPGRDGLLRQYEGPYSNVLGQLVRNFILKNHIDVFYITAPFLATPDIGYNCVYQKEWFDGVAVVATLYDIIPYVMRKHYLNDRAAFSRYMSCVDMLRWVDRCVTISESAKEDTVRKLNFNPRKIDVAYLGVAQRFQPLNISAEERRTFCERFGIHDSFLMCTISTDMRKNAKGAIQGYSMLPQTLKTKYQLVMVGHLTPEAKEQYRALIHGLGLDGLVLLTDYVTDEEIVCFYNHATLLLFPSLYEGFGLPIIEAWACHTPVVSSNNSSLGEITGNAGITFNPSAPKDIARALEEALTTADLTLLADCGQEKARLFTWEQTAKKTMDSIRQAYEEKRDAPLNKDSVRCVFWMVGALPQAWKQFLSQLSRRMELTVTAIDLLEPWDDSISCIPLSELLHDLRPNEQILYVTTDSVQASELDFMQKHPGIWVILDLAMDALVAAVTGTKKFEDFALCVKMATYFSENEIALVGEAELLNIAKVVITANPEQRERLVSKSLNTPIYGVYDGAGNSEFLLDNFYTAIHEKNLVQNRESTFSTLCEKVRSGGYQIGEIMAFSRTLGAAFSTEDLMHRTAPIVKKSDPTNLKVAMVTSWNVKCGIAEYTKYYMTATADAVDFTVFPSQAENLLSPDSADVAPRLWTYHGSVSQLAQALLNTEIPIVHIQYTEGFFSAEGLCELIETLASQKQVFITCHNSQYLEVHTQTEQAALKQAQFVVHQQAEFKNLVGQGVPLDHIHLIPLGQIVAPDRSAEAVRSGLGISSRGPILGSYGFLLPHKALVKVIEAVGLLKKKHPDILYIASCAALDDRSISYREICMQMVQRLNLEKNIKLVTDFLAPEESIFLLQACDVLVMTYDLSGESASGAVRFCVATGKPLLTTQQPIFAEFTDYSLQIETNKPAEIARGVEELLQPTAQNKYAALLREKIAQTSWSTVSRQYVALYTKQRDKIEIG